MLQDVDNATARLRIKERRLFLNEKIFGCSRFLHLYRLAIAPPGEWPKTGAAKAGDNQKRFFQKALLSYFDC
jgi:hypothetical protein